MASLLFENRNENGLLFTGMSEYHEIETHSLQKKFLSNYIKKLENFVENNCSHHVLLTKKMYNLDEYIGLYFNNFNDYSLFGAFIRNTSDAPNIRINPLPLVNSSILGINLQNIIYSPALHAEINIILEEINEQIKTHIFNDFYTKFGCIYNNMAGQYDITCTIYFTNLEDAATIKLVYG